MVEQFTLAMGDTSETRCVMLDKDVNEIVAVKALIYASRQRFAVHLPCSEELQGEDM